MQLRFQFVRHWWFRTLVGGVVLFFAVEQALKTTGNPNFIATVLLLGAFTVPAALVAYFYERERLFDRGLHGGTPLGTVASCFIAGGALGVVVAGLLEYGTLRNLGFAGLLGVGVVEESAKLILPLALYLQARFKSEADGLLFGVAAGMGFAALETMGYGLVTLVSANGRIGPVEQVLLIRGLLSPAGHAAWTGLVCAILWRERGRGHGTLNRATVGAFAIAVVLHTLWNVVNSLSTPTTTMLVIVILGSLIIAGTSLTLLIRRAQESSRTGGPLSLRVTDEQAVENRDVTHGT